MLKFLSLALLASSAAAHMVMSYPPPRGSKSSPPIDYDLNAPLGDGKPFPCGGKKASKVTATLHAGTHLNSSLLDAPGANFHDGGHCQFAVSYDEKNWVVLATVIRECLRQDGLNYDIPIPIDIPQADRATFAWTWINAEGNREYYMNCADVKIVSNSNSFSGPELFVANLPGYPTIPEMALVKPAKDGRQYLTDGARKTITVSNGNQPTATAKPTTKPTTAAPSTAKTTKTTKTTKSKKTKSSKTKKSKSKQA
ncbi:uncharacterized protein BJ171DRAFT_211097 [Polychytrium aggregatum]|uniref:uncharacterized protein n=1 Tax=Polychytrium aggregatum TaxID=110093 RepID=UPI0022FE19B4|nr:uncharacterized protein BJ171DRAFT_211097 [Polychytrium aggregatum]KAI9208619.1 hypothetical protein BJ171DRAFT_211097 [Polychytrium aggregatum]